MTDDAPPGHTDLDRPVAQTGPNRLGHAGRQLALRHAGLLASSAVALVWLVLARRAPSTTYHFAPLVVAASWGLARRWADGARGPRSTALAAALGGAAVAAITTAELAWVGALAGPTFWSQSDAWIEAVLSFTLGGGIGAWAVRRP